MSRVQFNLLPDVKLDYIKTERTRKLVTSIATIVSAVSLGIFLLLILTVDVVQKKQLHDSQAKVKTSSEAIQNVKNISQALTVQNQLNSLVELNQSKHVTSRLYKYLPQVTPTNVSIAKVDVDFTSNSIVLSGSSDSQHSINIFIDTLKFTNYKVGEEKDSHSAFPSVIETTFALNSGTATFGLNIQFDPKLFSNKLLDSSGKPQEPKLDVPQLTTTRSVLEVTDNPLFKEIIKINPQSTTGGGR